MSETPIPDDATVFQDSGRSRREEVPEPAEPGPALGEPEGDQTTEFVETGSGIRRASDPPGAPETEAFDPGSGAREPGGEDRDRADLDTDPMRTLDYGPTAGRSTVADGAIDGRPPGDPETTAYHPPSGRDGPEATREMPAFGSRQAPPQRRPAATAPTIDGYRILGELGRGGMGVVYKARHIALDRTVALKVILAGGHADATMYARFVAEAQAVALLHHPNIVQIYEIGEAGGLPYFSLEFVEGGSLEGQIAGTPQDARRSAGLVETLARAMHAAHVKGVVHRDLKPANVLLTQDGVPKITDFGLAKRLEGDSGQTRSGTIMGTPSFMAPEQAWGKNSEVGPHSDVYALGAILYNLLTGRPPFQGTTLLETLEQVRGQEPVPPSQLRPKLPRDLETICLKCLQKEPHRRYDDAEQLAADLRRFLDDEPILARPVSAPERLWRWCHRNPRVAVLSASVLALLVAVAGISFLSAARLNSLNVDLEQRNEDLRRTTEFAQLKQREAEDNAELARKNEAEAKAALDEVIDQNLNALEAWRSLGRLTMQDLSSIPGTQDLRRRFIEQIQDGLFEQVEGMQPYYQAARNVDNPRKADMVMGQTHKLVGDILVELGQVTDALEQYRRMGEVAERLLAEVPDEYGYMAFLASNRLALGDVSRKSLSDMRAAIGYYEEALDLARRWLATGREPDRAQSTIANTLGQIATVFLLLGQPDRARAYFREEIRTREGLPGWIRGDFTSRREESELHARLAQVALQLGEVEEARREYEHSFAIRERLARESPDDFANLRDVYRSYTNFGHVNLIQLADPVAAEDYYRRALEGFESLRERDDSPIIRADIGRACYYTATALLRMGETAESDALYRRCLEIRRALVVDPVAKTPEIDLMVALGRCGEHAEAADIARKLIATPPQNSQIYFQAACGFSLAAGAAERAGAEPGVRDGYVRSAVDALRGGIADGWRSFADLELDPDLDPIRGHPEFRLLLMDVKFPDEPFAVVGPAS